MLGLDRPDDTEITGQFPAGYERSPKGGYTGHWGNERQARLLIPVIRTGLGNPVVDRA